MFKLPDSYVFPCKNNGKCRQIMFEEQGFKWETYACDHGVVNLDRPNEHGWTTRIGSYKCCTQCHLPINQAEATRVNKLLGFELAEIKVDDDFLELLNDF